MIGFYSRWKDRMLDWFLSKLAWFNSNKPAMLGWMVATVCLTVLLYNESRQQLGVLAYKNLLLCNGVVAGHWVDNSFFKDKSDDVNEIARAIVFLGVIWCLGGGL